MPPYDVDVLHERFRAAARSVAAARPEVDADLALELLDEAARMLHDSLALDAIDERDADAVMRMVADCLVAPNPGAALRAQAAEVAVRPGTLHDPDEAAAACLITAQVLQV